MGTRYSSVSVLFPAAAVSESSYFPFDVSFITLNFDSSNRCSLSSSVLHQLSSLELTSREGLIRAPGQRHHSQLESVVPTLKLPPPLLHGKCVVTGRTTEHGQTCVLHRNNDSPKHLLFDRGKGHDYTNETMEWAKHFCPLLQKQRA